MYPQMEIMPVVITAGSLPFYLVLLCIAVTEGKIFPQPTINHKCGESTLNFHSLHIFLSLFFFFCSALHYAGNLV